MKFRHLGNRALCPLAVFALTGLLLQACAKKEGVPQATAPAPAPAAASPTPSPGTEATAAVPSPVAEKTLATVEIQIDQDSFKCLEKMTAVRHFFVDNLLGNLDATVAVAQSTEGGTYPPGSVVQLVPTEVMVKHHPGWNAATRDWEFFELDVSAEGSAIRKRGFVDVVNRFGGNCFACHIKAEPKYDLICEREHGCDPIPITREVIAGIQAEDPRCAG